MSMLNTLSIFFILFLILTTSAVSAPLTGKATVRSAAVAGITVSVYPVSTQSFDDKPVYQSRASTSDGLFNLDVAPGQYYLIARGEKLFTYYGRNPVSVPKEGVQDINMLMAPTDGLTPANQPFVETGVMGYVTQNGQPVEGATVTVYQGLSNQLKGFGLGVSRPTDKYGFFEVPLEPGSYYLVVRLRKSGSFAGPLRSGDLFGYYPGNAVVLKKDEVQRVAIPLIEVPEKVDRFAASMFGNTSITGMIVDQNGNPLEGMRAVLYNESAMITRPEHVSQPTGKDGTYVISFPKGGTYFLAARSVLGGTPAPGELYGVYAGTRDGSIFVRSGKNLKNITITVGEIQ